MALLRSQMLFLNYILQGSPSIVYIAIHFVPALRIVTIKFVDGKMNASKGLHLMRTFSTTAVRNSHAYGGPGSNLPFDVYSKYKFTALLAIYFSSGFGLPFLMVRYIKHRAL